MVGRRDLIKRGAGSAAALAVGAHAAAPDAPPAPAPPHKYALLVVDRSGSMIPLQEATIFGINALLTDQRRSDNLSIGIIQFDSPGQGSGLDVTETRPFQDARTIKLLEDHEFQPRGSTPLLAAFVEGVSRLEKLVRPEDEALLVVQTDGLENSSPAEITKDVVQRLVTAKQDQGNWTFVFMGAGIDAWGEGGAVGVPAGNTVSYDASAGSTQVAYRSTSGNLASWAAAPRGTTASFYQQSTTTQPKEDDDDKPNE